MRDSQRPRLVLASLVPVKNRSDPLDHMVLPQTDFGLSSALLPVKCRHLEKDAVLESAASPSSAQENQHEFQVGHLEQQLVDVRRQWTQQQERSFDLQITTSASSARLPTHSVATHSQSRHDSQASELHSRLRAVEDLIRDAGVALALTSSEDPPSLPPTTQEKTPLEEIHDLYTQAATQLAETLRALHSQQQRNQ